MKKTWDEHHRVNKGWGSEIWIVNKPEYCGKYLYINKDKKLSMHYHELKDETFLISKGLVELTYYEDETLDKFLKRWRDVERLVKSKRIQRTLLEVGDTFHIPVRMRHSLKGVEFVESLIVEFSTQHFEEDSLRVLKGN